MAEAVLAITNPHVSIDSTSVHVMGTLTIPAGDYVNNGIALSFLTQVTPPIPGVSSAPVHAQFQGKAGYQYEYDAANAKLLIRLNKNPADAGGADIPFPQLAASALPAGVTGDTVTFHAIFKKFQ